jgi:hypothetical protein
LALAMVVLVFEKWQFEVLIEFFVVFFFVSFLLKIRYSSYHYTHPDLVSRLEAVTLQMGGAPMPEDVVKQYVKMPEVVAKKDAATKEVAKEGVKEEKQVSNNDANAQSTAPTATAHVYDLEEDSDDDDDDDDEPSGVVMEPPSSPPPPQGIQARIGLYN